MSNWQGWNNYNPNNKKTPPSGGLPKVTEKEITKQIRDYLKLKGIMNWKVWQGLGSQKGIPDILAILPPLGRLMAIEVKTNKGRVSPHQEEFIQSAKVNGAVSFVARSVTDVQRVLEDIIKVK